jgi:hypothetical protein
MSTGDLQMSERALNQLIYKAYDVTPEEIALVEKG